MSGIAGIIRFDGGPVEPGLVEKMTASMSYRGPDGINHWVQGSVALGQCMLRTTPESLEETQPLLNDDGSLVLVMDGRVDNWEELRTELLARGARLRTRADAELVLRAYEVWGKDCPLHLLGDFAFAIWDARRNEVFCVRDHFGIKPFYYFKAPTFLAFASDEEGFFGLPEVPLEANEDRIACVFVQEFDGIDFDDSWLKHVVKLSPGSTLSARPGGYVSERKYWKLEAGEESQFASELECEEAFRSVFSKALQCRLRVLGDPGLMLSGGIDSASIAGAIRSSTSLSSKPELHTFSVVSDAPETCLETRNILAIIKGHEDQAHLHPLSTYRHGAGLDDLRRVAWGHAHPVDNSILVPALMYLSASRAGHRVMFDGIDGDLATFTHEFYFSELLRTGNLRQAWVECRQASVNHTYARHRSPLALYLRGLWHAAAPNRVKVLKDQIRQARTPNGPFERNLINPAFANRIGLLERYQAWRQASQIRRPLTHQDHHIGALFPVGIPRGAEGFDRVAARYGIEPRHPWADKRLIEFYLRLPTRFKVREGWTKYLVRRASAPWLDASVRWHTGKAHLGWPLTRQFMKLNEGSMVSAFHESLVSTIDQYVDTTRLGSVLDKYPDHENDWELQQLYHVLTVSLWLWRLKTEAERRDDVRRQSRTMGNLSLN